MKSPSLRHLLLWLCLLLLPLTGCDRIMQTRARNAFNRGVTKERGGDLPGAIAEFTEALSRDPKHVDAYIRRGACRGQSGDLTGALADVDAALGLNPDSTTALITRGVILQRRQEPEAALADYDRALTLDPKSTWAYQNRGFLKRMRHDVDGALADFNQALALSPDDAAILENRGALLQDRGDSAAALADFERAVRLEPRRALAYAGRGSVKAQTGDVRGALADFDRALNLDSSAGFVFRARGLLHLKLAHWEEAQDDFLTYCEEPGAEQDYPRLFIWICQARSGHAAKANEGLTTYMKSRTPAPGGDWAAQVAGHLLGSVTEARLLAAAESPDPATAAGQRCEAWYYVGVKKILSGDTAGAAAAFQKCVDTGITGFVEYDLAKAELPKLKAAG